jgi:hypothetical protein
MRTDEQTEMTKLIVAFRNFAKAPKKTVYDSFYICALSAEYKCILSYLLNVKNILFFSHFNY